MAVRKKKTPEAEGLINAILIGAGMVLIFTDWQDRQWSGLGIAGAGLAGAGLGRIITLEEVE